MLTGCSNSSCAAPFRYLEDGRLFCLESDPAIRSSKPNRTQYFWLCHRCSSTITLRLREDGKVETVPLPEAIRGVPDCIALTLLDRKNGLLLHSISSHSRAASRGRTELKSDTMRRDSENRDDGAAGPTLRTP
jgi:hypothetical protein